MTFEFTSAGPVSSGQEFVFTIGEPSHKESDADFLRTCGIEPGGNSDTEK